METLTDYIKLKELIQKEEYNECCKILEESIIKYIVQLIKKKKKDYKYTNLIDLIDESKFYIEDENKSIAEKLKFFSIEEGDRNKFERLLNLCETYNICLKEEEE